MRVGTAAAWTDAGTRDVDRVGPRALTANHCCIAPRGLPQSDVLGVPKDTLCTRDAGASARKRRPSPPSHKAFWGCGLTPRRRSVGPDAEPETVI